MIGHIERKDDNDWVKRCMTWEVEGIRPRGCPKKTWWDCVKNEMESLGLSQKDAQFRNKWRRMWFSLSPGKMAVKTECVWVCVQFSLYYRITPCPYRKSLWQLLVHLIMCTVLELFAVQSLGVENRRLQQDSDAVRQQLKDAVSANDDKLRLIQQQLTTKINELYVVNDSLADLVHTAK